MSGGDTGPKEGPRSKASLPGYFAPERLGTGEWPNHDGPHRVVLETYWKRLKEPLGFPRNRPPHATEGDRARPAQAAAGDHRAGALSRGAVAGSQGADRHVVGRRAFGHHRRGGPRRAAKGQEGAGEPGTVFKTHGIQRERLPAGRLEGHRNVEAEEPSDH